VEALTKSGKNMEQVMGKWEDVVYLSDKSTDEQQTAVTKVLKAELGADFGKLEIKTAPLTVNCEGERHSIAIGQVGTLRIVAIKGASGKVPVIENAPFRGALPRLHCAKAEVHTYDDGTSKWDFAGPNGFYGAFEMKSK
jgi:hypothetical protein